MKLLILTQKVDSTDDNLGFFHRWIEEFALQCEQVIVICLYEGKHELPTNVRVLSLGKEERSSRFERLRRLYRYVWNERNNYDTVFVHMNQIYILLCGLLWRILGKRIGLWYAHGEVSTSLRVATVLTDHVFTSTPHGFNIDTSKRHIIGQGIDETLFEHVQAADANKCQLISWGRISPAKDYMTMLRAVKRLRDVGVDVCLDIIGGVGAPDQQQYLDTLTKFVRENNLTNVVNFVGPITHDELPAHITKGSIFLHASTNGSLDKAALEAMVGGLLVVTCNESVASVMPMVYREQLMFPISDDAVLTKKIRTLILLSQDERATISRALHDVVRWDHSLKALIKKICNIFEESSTPEIKKMV